jgi:hypothetical protein
MVKLDARSTQKCKKSTASKGNESITKCIQIYSLTTIHANVKAQQLTIKQAADVLQNTESNDCF